MIKTASRLWFAACALAVSAQAAGPKVMLLIDEKSLGTIPTAEVEALAVRLFLEKNVEVLDQDMVRANVAKSQQLLKMSGDNRGAAALGLQLGADVIVVGEAVAKPSARRIAESNLRTYQAAVTLRAVRTDNSSTVASASEDASVAALDDVAGSAKALKAAGKKSLESLVPALLAAWAKNPGGAAGAGGTNSAPATVEVLVGGVDQVWKLKAVRELLRGMKSEIRKTTQRNYTTGVAIFDVESRVPSEDLAEKLVLSPPEGMKFQIQEITPAKISLKAVVVEP